MPHAAYSRWRADESLAGAWRGLRERHPRRHDPRPEAVYEVVRDPIDAAHGSVMGGPATLYAPPADKSYRAHMFAACLLTGVGGSTENVIQIWRGGGLEFELTVILEWFAILHHMNKVPM